MRKGLVHIFILCLVFFLSCCNNLDGTLDNADSTLGLINLTPTVHSNKTELADSSALEKTPSLVTQGSVYDQIRIGNVDNLSIVDQLNLSNPYNFAWIGSWESIAVISIDNISIYKRTSPDKYVATNEFKSFTPILLSTTPGSDALAWVDAVNSIHYFNMLTNAEPTTVSESDDKIIGLALSNGGQTLAVSTYDYFVEIWDMANFNRLDRWQFSMWLSDLSYSPEGDLLAGLDKTDSRIYIIDTDNGNIIRTLELENQVSSSLAGIKFSNDWKYVAWLDGSTIHITDTEDGTLVNQLYHEDPVNSISWSPDNRIITAAAIEYLDEDFSPVLNLWDVDKAVVIKKIIRDTLIIENNFSPSGYLLGVLEDNGALSFWAVKP